MTKAKRVSIKIPKQIVLSGSDSNALLRFFFRATRVRSCRVQPYHQYIRLFYYPQVVARELKIFESASKQNFSVYTNFYLKMPMK